jgi:F-type H+-transporting ATPase subunit epsilon
MADSNLFLEILSPSGSIFSGNVDEVIAHTVNGQIAILPQHTALFTKLTEGEIVVKKGSDETLIAVLGGFLDVQQNKVNIMADYAVRSDDISEAKAQAAKEKAEELLKERGEKQDFVEIEKDLKKSILELKVAERIRKRTRI